MLRFGAGALAGAVLALTPITFVHFSEKPRVPAATIRFHIQPPENTDSLATFALSPDGRKLAFTSGRRLWVHFLESGELRDLTDANANGPFWSADSRFIGYRLQNKLKRIEATGGPPQTVADGASDWRGGAWNHDDVIVFGSLGGLFRVPASGGVPVPITTIDPARQESYPGFPSFLPDGKHFVYIRAFADKEKDAIYLGSLDAKPEQQSSKPLVRSPWEPVYAPSADRSAGYLLFMREGTLMAQPFDERRLVLTGQATPIAEQVGDQQLGIDDSYGGLGAFSASANDVLVFWRNVRPDRQLNWYSRQGKVLGTACEPGNYYSELARSRRMASASPWSRGAGLHPTSGCRISPVEARARALRSVPRRTETPSGRRTGAA